MTLTINNVIMTCQSHNISTNSGTSIVSLVINKTTTYYFKYTWVGRRPDISLFKHYKNKEVKLTLEKPTTPCMCIKCDLRDFKLGKPKADLYGKRGKYIGTSKGFGDFLFNEYYKENKNIICLYIIEKF